MACQLLLEGTWRKSVFLDHLGRSLSKNDLKVVEYNVINMECIVRGSEVCWNGSSSAS